MPKWVYNFGAGEAEGHADLQGSQDELLGNKGANLAEMASLGLPVPPGFTLTTEVCSHFVSTGTYPEGLQEQVQKSLQVLESRVGCKFGDSENPLLVAVRAGAREIQPGMMDTVLNVGLNAKTVEALAEQSGDERFAYDSYRRFIQMYSEVVLGLDSRHFEKMLQRAKEKRGVKQDRGTGCHSKDQELRVEDLERLVRDYKTKVFVELGAEFPTDPQAMQGIGRRHWMKIMKQQTLEIGTKCLRIREADPMIFISDHFGAFYRIFQEESDHQAAGCDAPLGPKRPPPADRLGHQRLPPSANSGSPPQGLPASPGAAVGKVVFDADEVGDVLVEKGQKLTIDGSTGEVLLGEVPTVVPKVTGAFRTLMSWSDEFFSGMRITAMRQMILASDTRDRKDALHRLLFMQREDGWVRPCLMEATRKTSCLDQRRLEPSISNTMAYY
eukprot:Skav202266  [mRNA]  locus=scaffold1417:463583:470160:- [translate_table: standard]